MNPDEYSFFYRRTVDVTRIEKEIGGVDVFISSFNSSDRVKEIYQEVSSKEKYWMIHPEYKYSPLELPEGNLIEPDGINEKIQVDTLLNAVGDIGDKRVCIDITGFMRHVLIFLIAKLNYAGVGEVRFLYSEPMYYLGQEDTVFSTTTSGNVRPIMGMSGSNFAKATDYLVIGIGYDHRLISEVVNNKDSSIVYPLFSFPSLSPDMYQQSALRASISGDVALDQLWTVNRKFSPANDPFSTAGVLKEILEKIEGSGSVSNIYLSPLSTKVQALGFALFWVREAKRRNSSISLLMPECLTYSRETSVGIKRVWEYVVDFTALENF